MSLSKEIFIKYFSSKMSGEELYKKIGASSEQFESELKHSFQETVCNRDGEMLEYLIYSLFLCETEINLSDFNDVLNKLIISTWHEQHENIAMLLQKNRNELSINYLYEAINLKLAYLDWDDNYAFGVKCIWALGGIGTKEAKEKLKILAESKNKIIKDNAINQLNRLS